MIGPPTVPPNWWRLSPSSTRLPSGPTAANGLVALNRRSRTNSNALPDRRLVPDFVTAFTDAPECMPFCGAQAARGDAEFLQRVREGQRQVQVVVGVVVHRAVERVGDAVRQAAADRDRDAARVVARRRRLLIDRRSGEHQQAGHLAPLQRQLDDALVFDDFADAGAAHVDERRRGFDRDRFREVANRQCRVDGRGWRRPAARCRSAA